MLVVPLVSFDAIDRKQLNDCLVSWGHKMGKWNRPNFGSEAFHGLFHHGSLVAVSAAARLIPKQTAGFSRDEAFELGRMCAIRPDLNRVTLRLWREFVFPRLCAARGWTWAISYQDAVLHSGDLYRFDGWIRVGHSKSGPDKRSGLEGRDKIIWAWHTDPAIRAMRKSEGDFKPKRTDTVAIADPQIAVDW